MIENLLNLKNNPDRKRYIDTENKNILLCGYSAAGFNRLAYRPEALEIYTQYSELDNLNVRGFVLCHYHLNDNDYVECIGDKIYKPTREKCIIDTIIFLDKNYNEGLLIEMLQNYSEQENRNFEKLYEVGVHYNVTKETIDYWIKEADEETDMSMG